MVISERKVLHLEGVIDNLITLMRQQANVVFGIRAESLLDLSKELSNGGVGGYLYFKDSIAILVDGESEDVGVFFDGGFAIGVEGKG